MGHRNQTKGSVVQLAVDECTIKQTVYIYNCEGATIQINGKVNTVTGQVQKRLM